MNNQILFIYESKSLFDIFSEIEDNLNFKVINLTKKEIVAFLETGTASNIRITIEDLDLIIEGGHSFIKEAYPNWTKPEARKIRKYLINILNDAEKDKDNKSRRVRSK